MRIAWMSAVINRLINRVSQWFQLVMLEHPPHFLNLQLTYPIFLLLLLQILGILLQLCLCFLNFLIPTFQVIVMLFLLFLNLQLYLFLFLFQLLVLVLVLLLNFFLIRWLLISNAFFLFNLFNLLLKLLVLFLDLLNLILLFIPIALLLLLPLLNPPDLFLPHPQLID